MTFELTWGIHGTSFWRQVRKSPYQAPYFGIRNYRSNTPSIKKTWGIFFCPFVIWIVKTEVSSS